jgi:hypothetical protein
MKTILLLAVVALACTAGATTARAAADPGAAVQADIAKLVSDATTLHDAIKGDADEIAADVQALQGTTDRKAALAKLRADWKQVLADHKELFAPVKADWEQLMSDLKALRASKDGSHDLGSLLQQMRQALSLQRDAVEEATASVHTASKALRAGFRKK